MSLVRRPDADLAEAALLLCVEAEPDLDVEVELLRIDALTDGLRTRGFEPGPPAAAARALAGYLAGDLGFTGAPAADYHQPRNGLLTFVLDERAGAPITLSVVYVSVARRLGVPAYGVGLPGHFVVGLGSGADAVVLDPYHDGVVLDEAALRDLVASATRGRVGFRRSMLRPTPAAAVVRRILNNLTRDFRGQGDAESARWTVELKLALPGATAGDLRALAEIELSLGRFDRAAASFDRYARAVGPDAPDHADAVTRAARARARLN